MPRTAPHASYNYLVLHRPETIATVDAIRVIDAGSILAPSHGIARCDARMLVKDKLAEYRANFGPGQIEVIVPGTRGTRAINTMELPR